jgi:small-conductance mechanosensitive channel
MAASAHAGTTDSTVSPDGNFLYDESGAAGTIDTFSVRSTDVLTPVETLSNLAGRLRRNHGQLIVRVPNNTARLRARVA